jgi:hypothetical protein
MVAVTAPNTELSTRLRMPITNSPIIEKKMRNGMMPARASFSFSISGMFSSSSVTTGASLGLILVITTT